MAAKVFGVGIHSVDAEDGMTIQKFSADAEVDTAYHPDEDGYDISGAFFNERASFSMEGFKKTGETLDAGVGAAIALTNDIGLAEFGIATGGKTILTAASRSLENRAFGGLNGSGIYLPLLGALQV